MKKVVVTNSQGKISSQTPDTPKLNVKRNIVKDKYAQM